MEQENNIDMDNTSVVHDVHEIKNTLTKFSIRLELVYNALVGNEISKDGGLVTEIADQKAEIILLRRRIETVEKKEDNRQQLIRTIYAIGAFLAGLIVTLTVTHFWK